MTPEQSDLLLQAMESLKAARLLQNNGYHGFSASRAYYAMFYVAEAFLIGKGLSFSKHSAVHAAFAQHFGKAPDMPPEFHRHLAQGMEVRHAGDYGKGKRVSAEQAEKQIAHAQQFIELAQRLIGPLPPET